MTDKELIKSYVSPEVKELLEGLSKEVGLSVSKLVWMAVINPKAYCVLLEKYVPFI